jgi:hypothetical protein
MSQQELDLLQLTSGRMAKSRAAAAEVRSSIVIAGFIWDAVEIPAR